LRRQDTARLPGSTAGPAQEIFSFLAISPVKRLLDTANRRSAHPSDSRPSSTYALEAERLFL